MLNFSLMDFLRLDFAHDPFAWLIVAAGACCAVAGAYLATPFYNTFIKGK